MDTVHIERTRVQNQLSFLWRERIMDLYTGKTALITGASSGIGAAFATRLAAAGTHLILVARTVFEETQQRGLTVDILINNAGFGTYGQFETLDAEREQQEILLNVATLVDLTHHFLPVMVARRQGASINVATRAAFQPCPYMAVYGASKAFVLSFSEALWGEYRTKGVRILAVCPGETATEFFHVVGNGYDTPLGNVETPEKVVRVALRALGQGRPSVISGRQNALTANVSRFVPRGLVVRMMAQVSKPRQRAR